MFSAKLLKYEGLSMRTTSFDMDRRWLIISHLRFRYVPVSYKNLPTHETVLELVCRLLLEKKKILYF